MTDKKYLEGILAVIDHVSNGNHKILCEDGERLSGNYWPAIYQLFKERRIGAGCNGGDFIVTQPQYLAPLYEECHHHLEVLEREERDRELDNQEKIENITYGRKGYKLSKIAIWLSALAIVVEIARGILDLIL